LREVDKINERQKELLIKKLAGILWNIPDKDIAIWGVAFKPDTDDIRSAPSIDIIKQLVAEGARVRAFDPAAMNKAKGELGEKNITWCRDAYEAVDGADCLILMTEWNEFKEVDWQRLKKIMKQPIILDGRNIYDPEEIKKLGFKYVGMGRK